VAGILALSCSLAHTESRAAPPGPSPGDRIRVSLMQPDGWRWIGTLVEARVDSLLFRPEQSAGDMTVSRLRLAKLEVSRGVRSHAGRNAGLGLLVGGLLGTVIGVAAHGDSDDLDAGSSAVLVGASLGVLGAGFGALSGAVHRSEDWRTVETREP
jgi:hypothetical protein